MFSPNWRATLDPAITAALEYLEGLPSRHVGPQAAPEVCLASLERTLPQRGLPAAEVVRDLVVAAAPGLTAMPSGRFFGWVIGGALPAALAADWLTSAWDQNAGSADGTPAAAAIEHVVLEWIMEVLDLPRESSAALVTGAQMANTTCLAAARHRVLAGVGWDVEADGLIGAPRVNVVVGGERHDTILRSLRLLGLGVRQVHAAEVDSQGRMQAASLARILADLTGPTIVCAQAGNVNTGAMDPFEAINHAMDSHRARVGHDLVWLHVDGAFGLWARASRALRASAAGIERANSWTTDAHKWLNTPYDCGIAIVADPSAHRGSMRVRAAYIPDADAQLVRTPWDYTPEFSRRARGFAVYAALRHLGREGIAELVDRCCALARSFAEQLQREPGIEVLNEVALNQVLVRFRDPSGQDDDAHTRRVVQRVQAEGTCFMSGTVWQGKAAMRISVSNWSTDEADVGLSVASLIRAHHA